MPVEDSGHLQCDEHGINERMLFACAEAILRWHTLTGVDEAKRKMPASDLKSYLARLVYFSERDRCCPSVQRDIAWEQIAGQFEWAYHATLSKDVWGDLLGIWPREQSVPSKTCDAAQLIISLLGRPKSETVDSDQASRKTVDVSDHEELDREANLFYHEQMAEEGLGIGGRNVLLACSLERSDALRSPCSVRRITLMAPHVLGMHKIEPGERTDDFIDAIRSGRIVVTNIAGE